MFAQVNAVVQAVEPMEPVWISMVQGALIVLTLAFAVSRFLVPVKGELERTDVPIDFWCIIGGVMIAYGSFGLALGGSSWLIALILSGFAGLCAHGFDYFPESEYLGPPRDPSVTNLYKDAAHTFVGVLVAASLVWPWMWYVTGFITVVEVVAFIARRKKKP